ncbi:MAG: sigma-54-dependent Fis family transcriptional regulator [Proteobacteria bacterium]|nr:sigma-54-dependent Fis family transcriptional regulator [Pseudomonadota bacterium]
MKINTVVYLSGPRAKLPIRSSLTGERPQDLESEKCKHDLPAVFLVDTSHLEKFRRLIDVVVDRGTKNIRKGLADYLTGLSGEKIPIIDGNYTSAGRLLQGIQALLDRATGIGEKKLYIIGAAGQLFDAIWQQTGDKAGETRNHLDAVMKDPLQQPRIAEVNSWLLQELGQHCDLPAELSTRYLGNSEDAGLVRLLIMLAAKNVSPVLILGDTGTGKEIVARQIHQNSQQSEGPFIPVNCGAIPEDILESELFGHIRGAFTNAFIDRVGLWVAAKDGTLFLDEIGDLSLANQAKILRALTDRQIRPVGLTKEIEINSRIIAATNRDLFAMVQTGEFREDLYYRLRSFFIRTPSLRNNRGDIPPIAQILWRRITKEKSKPLPSEIISELKKHSWPGNIRELKMMLTYLNNLFPNQNLRLAHLRSVFYIEGRSKKTGEAPVSEKDLILHRAECLRHLKRAHEVIHACCYDARLLVKSHPRAKQDPESAQRNLTFRFHELKRLCRRDPLLFHSKETFDLVNAIKGKITWFLGLLQKDHRDARKYWELEVKAAFENVQTALFNGIEKITAES